MDLLVTSTLLTLLNVNVHGAVIELPDPLTLSNGQKVNSIQEWQTRRRPELLELFSTQIYGRPPVGRPKNLKFELSSVQKGAMNGAATRKQIVISFEGTGGKGEIHLLLFVPKRIPKPAPCFVLINNRGARNADPERIAKSPFWPAEELIARGYAAATFLNSDLDPDNDDGFKDGVHGLFDGPGQRSPDAWATIAAWAWGASRVMDYLESDGEIDAKRVAIVGHSRGGKTALWAGAQDERFALVVSNNSGCTGAALSRGKQGESVAKINENFPHWFAQNHKKYDGREAELPVDQHELLALIAPRLVYIASATEDSTSDPEAEFKAGVAATPVYRLFGLSGLQAPELPQPGVALLDGRIGYHLRAGKHDLTPYDWARFMDFADKHFVNLKANEHR